MTVPLDLSSDSADILRNAFGNDLSRAALEAIAIEGYCAEKLSRFDVQKLLQFDNRWDTEAWLGNHGVNRNYSLADLEADRLTLDALLGPANS